MFFELKHRSRAYFQLIGLSFPARFYDLANCLATSSALSSVARVWLPQPACQAFSA